MRRRRRGRCEREGEKKTATMYLCLSVSRSLRQRRRQQRCFSARRKRLLVQWISCWSSRGYFADITTFTGRLLFASVFMLVAWQEYNQFGADCGPAARSLKPKLDGLSRIVSSKIGVQVPLIVPKQVVAASIAMKRLGGILFVLGSSAGANLLIIHRAHFTPIVYDFYKHDVNKKSFSDILVPFVQNMALLGALLFYVGMNNATPVTHQPKKRAHKPKAN